VLRNGQNVQKSTYTFFDPAMAVDANELPLLLRFSGEVSRSEWSLSWRIFRDSCYAQAMIEVQKDWHYQTYQRGIATMKRIIAGGDDDNANYRELSGLYAFTGQYDLAADFCRQALARISDPASRLNMSIQLVGHLLNAGKEADAEATATAVLGQLPALRQRLGRSVQQIGLQLAVTSLNEDGTTHLLGMAQRTLHEVLQQPLDDAIAQVGGWIADNPSNHEVWANSTELRSLRGQIERTCGVIIDLAARCGPARMAADPDLHQLGEAVQHWLDTIAFHDCDDQSAILGRFAAAGSWDAAIQGEAAFDRLLEAVQPATDVASLQAERIGGTRQVARDLPWIRASVPYWYGRLARQFSRDHGTLDAQLVAHDALRLAEARTATAALGLSSPGYEMQADLGVEIAAMIAHDRQALHRVLVRIAKKNDKQLRDDAAQWIGDAARFLDPSWYAEVLAAWRDDVDYQPKYFWIAWRAALAKAPRQALMAAKLAAERFPHDTAFQEEYDFMRALLAPATPGAGTDPAAVPVAPPAPPGIIIPGPPPQHVDDGISSRWPDQSCAHAA
jgi:tetratricopeptide (TPR) repeat protein